MQKVEERGKDGYVTSLGWMTKVGDARESRNFNSSNNFLDKEVHGLPPAKKSNLHKEGPDT